MLAGINRLEKALFVLTIALGFSWIYFAGKDVNWDLINYHYYGAAQLVEGRLDQDFLAASIQSYINPIAYLPFYFLLNSGVGSLSIAFVLGAVHLGNLYFLWLISQKAIPGNTNEDIVLRWQALMLALASPVFLTVLGNTFIDPFSSLLVLIGLWLLYKGEPQANTCFWGGLLFGSAVGIKLTNLVFVPAFLFVLLVQSREKSRIRAMLYGITGLALGWLLLHGYWSYLLWEKFRNPVFPFANHIFQSNDFPPVSFHDKRFQQGGILDQILLPWRMIEPRSGIYTENISPDIRPLIFFLGTIACASITIFKKKIFNRPQIAILGFVLSAYVTWLFLSAIGRYALAIWLLCGTLMPYLYSNLFGKKVAIKIMLLALAAQIFHGFMTVGNFRWQPNRWDGPWLEADIPSSLKNNPALFLTIGVQTYASIIPFFNPESSFINIIGQYPLPYGKATLPKMRALIDKWQGNTYVIGSYRSRTDNLPITIKDDFSALINPYGFRIDDNVCQKIKISGANSTEWASSPPASSEHRNFNLWACKIEQSPSEITKTRALARASSVFEKAEKVCFGKFTPIPANTVQGSHGWQRLYFDQQSSLIIKDGILIYRPNHSFKDYIVGSVDDILNNGVNSGLCSKQAFPL